MCCYVSQVRKLCGEKMKRNKYTRQTRNGDDSEDSDDDDDYDDGGGVEQRMVVVFNRHKIVIETILFV